jgi:carboxyl-terminal processing protease
MEKGLIKVVSPIDGTPAARAGLHSGDVITSLDKKEIRGLTLQEAVDKMRGAPRAPITLTIVREGVDHPIRVKLIRSVIHVVPVKYQAEGDVGYLQVTSFNEKTTVDLQNAVKNLKKQIGPKLKGYVMDLRNDPGGLLDQAIAVADSFLERGTIVITKGRQETERSNARPGDIADGKKLVVLINGGSASASEIVAGALQDHHRATLVGTRSFGKGSVQTIIPLGSNGALMLTTARYYTPSGRSIQAQGIKPDVMLEEELPEGKNKRPEDREAEANLRGHLRPENTEGSGQEDDGSSSYVPEEKDKDTQLQYALDLVRGSTSLTAGTGPF